MKKDTSLKSVREAVKYVLRQPSIKIGSERPLGGCLILGVPEEVFNR